MALRSERRSAKLLPPGFISYTGKEGDSTYVDESAIDDSDDSSDWEEEITVTVNQDASAITFERVDPSPILTSGKSLITLMLRRGDSLGSSPTRTRQAQTKSPNKRVLPSEHRSGLDLSKQTNQPINKVHDSEPQPEPKTRLAPGKVYSPKTNRKEMLENELPSSVRLDVLHERSYKRAGHAPLERDHFDLKQYPENSMKGEPAHEEKYFWGMENIW